MRKLDSSKNGRGEKWQQKERLRDPWTVEGDDHLEASVHVENADQQHPRAKERKYNHVIKRSTPIEELQGFLQNQSGGNTLNPNNPLNQHGAPAANKANPMFNPSNPTAWNNPANTQMNPDLPGAANNPSNPEFNPSNPGAQNNPSNPLRNPSNPGALTNPSNPELNPALPGSLTNPSAPMHNPDYPNPEAIGQRPPGLGPNASFPPGYRAQGTWHTPAIIVDDEPQAVRTGMAADPYWLDHYMERNGPYLYHHSDEANIPSILERGLLPWDTEGIGTHYDGDLTPRPNHVYLQAASNPGHGRYLETTPSHVRVDLRKLDPERLNPDEDTMADPDAARTFGIPGTEHEWPDKPGGQSYGDWAEHHNFTSPAQTAWSLDGPTQTETIAHHGPIPPEAIDYPYAKLQQPVMAGRTADDQTQDTRQFPDPTEPRAARPPDPLGCTCAKGIKLECPVHGLHPTEGDYDHSWSLPEGQPVGYPQDAPRSWQQAVSSKEPEPETNGHGDAQLSALQERLAQLTASMETMKAEPKEKTPRRLVIHRDELGRMASIEAVEDD